MSWSLGSETIEEYVNELVGRAKAAGKTPTQFADMILTAAGVSASGAESGDFTSDTHQKKLVLAEDEVIRWSKGDDSYGFFITKKNDTVYFAIADGDSDAAGAASLFSFDLVSRTMSSVCSMTLVGNQVGLSMRGGVPVPTCNASASSDPTADDDSTYFLNGDHWVKESERKMLALVDKTDGAAVWQQLPFIKKHATASPTGAENYAAGYCDLFLWYEEDASKLWLKVSESAGTAVWKGVVLS